jgi:hypothetical protein
MSVIINSPIAGALERVCFRFDARFMEMEIERATDLFGRKRGWRPRLAAEAHSQFSECLPDERHL